MRLVKQEKNAIESLGFFAPCYAQPLADEDADIDEFTLPDGKVIRIKKEKQPRPMKQLPYLAMTIKKELDAQYRTGMTLNQMHTDAELAYEFQDLRMLALELPSMLSIYLAMHYDGVVANIKNKMTQYADGNTITLDEEWFERFFEG